MPGYDVQVLDEAHNPVEVPGKIGAICVKLPLPPSCLPTLWNERRALQGELSRGVTPATTRRPTPAIMDEDGYLYIMARTDDIINVAGHRLSTGGMEEVRRQRIRTWRNAR